MGWKAVKDHYQIGHIVHVRDGLLCIGSAYISEIISVHPDGRFKKRYDRAGGHADLMRYQHEIESDSGQFAALFAATDTFVQSLPVFTYERADIRELACEEYGFPNVTHCGEIMYENTHSPDKLQVIQWAKDNAQLGVRQTQRSIDAAEIDLRERRQLLADYRASLYQLEADYPEPA